MIFGKTKLELKVGVFVFGSVVILVAFIMLIGNVKTWTSGYRVNFVFNFVNGVKVGAPVRFAGVDVGEVKEINLFSSAPENKAKVKILCWINRQVRVPLDSEVWVNTLGLLGEKYIEIMPGRNYSRTLLANQELAGRDPMPMQEVGELAKRIGENLEKTVIGINSQKGTIGKLVYDDKIYTELEALVIDLRKHPWKLFWKGKER